MIAASGSAFPSQDIVDATIGLSARDFLLYSGATGVARLPAFRGMMQ
ncbi:hypothetical protein ACFSTD_10860 [Novosphingobium colocasiae]